MRVATGGRAGDRWMDAIWRSRIALLAGSFFATARREGSRITGAAELAPLTK
jgi:hypothetical protein